MNEREASTQAQGPVAQQIRARLKALDPYSLSIFDDSDRHRGHVGHNGAGESHFIVEIISPRFEGLTRIDQHKLVYALIGDLMKGPIHALAIKTGFNKP